MADMLKMVDEMQTHRSTSWSSSTNVTHEQTKRTHDSTAQDHAGPTSRSPTTARPHRGLRRLLPADAQLLLLGAALLRHPRVLLAARSLFDCPRRDRPMTDEVPRVCAGDIDTTARTSHRS